MVEKRLRTDSTFPPPKKRRYGAMDRISQLPDDILVLILSFFTVKEAAVTSVLARRWRYLWTSISNLNFDAEEALCKIVARYAQEGGLTEKEEEELLDTERDNYVDWVNNVLSLHNGQQIYGFRICFDLTTFYSQDIDDWIKFALSKRAQIQRFELDLSPSSGLSCDSPRMSYNFSDTLCHRTFPYSFSDTPFHKKFPYSFVGCTSLKSICLKSVHVIAEEVHYLLTHCPVLEVIRVHGSNWFGNLKVSGPSLMLKYLEIHYCYDIDTIEICDTNLKSFDFIGSNINLVIKNVPMLVEVSYIGDGVNRLGFVFNLFFFIGHFSCCLQQLEYLSLSFSRVKAISKLRAFPEFPKLKHLVLEFFRQEYDSLLPLNLFINACPSLQIFVLQMQWCVEHKKVRRPFSKVSPKGISQYLKVVELRGYYGCPTQLDLAMYFYQNAPALKKIIINTCFQRLACMKRDVKPARLVSLEQTAREIAMQQFEEKTRPGVEIIIL